MLIEFDLAGAEWVIVAYISGDKNMIDVVESGRSPHVATGALISKAPEDMVSAESEIVGSLTDPDALRLLREQRIPELLDLPGVFIPRTMSIRQAGKKSNHGLNYDMRYKRFALENEMPEPDAEKIVHLYRNEAYPGIPLWHDAVREELRTNDRTLKNLVGRKVRLLDQMGPDLWDKAYSFEPQSTVFDICREAFKRAFESPHPTFRHMDLKANVHDSILVDHPSEDWQRLREFAAAMKGLMMPELRAKGRSFTLGVDAKYGPNWGAMQKLDLAGTEDITEEWRRLRNAPKETLPLIRATV